MGSSRLAKTTESAVGADVPVMLNRVLRRAWIPRLPLRVGLTGMVAGGEGE